MYHLIHTPQWLFFHGKFHKTLKELKIYTYEKSNKSKK